MSLRLTLALAAVTAYSASLTAAGEPFPKFEVISAKPSAPNLVPTKWLWGDTNGKVILRRVTLAAVLMRAYAVDRDHLTGPAWLDQEYFDILATVPPGASRADLLLMFQGLLKERFELRSHTETTAKPVYALVVSPAGHRLTLAGNEFPAGIQEGAKMNSATNSMSAVSTAPDGIKGFVAVDFQAGFRISEWYGITMGKLAPRLTALNILDREVIDATGLEGSYRIRLDLPAAVPNQEEDVPRADAPSMLRDSLKKYGLMLEKRQAPISKLVIDGIRKVPTPN